MITAKVRPGPMLDDVVLTVSGVPAGTRWRVTGTASGWSGLDGQWSWMSAASVATGRPEHFVDVLAPIGLPATYRLDVDGTTTEPVKRTSSLRLDWITDDNARVGVPFIRAPEHEVQVTSGVHLYQVKGRPRPMVALDEAPTIGAEQVVVRTEGLDKATLRTMLLDNRPLVVHHNHAACRLPACDIAPAQRVIPTASKGALTRRLDEAERLWTIDFQEIDTDVGDLAPAVTWGDVLTHFGTWQAVRDSGLTWGALAEGAWLDEGGSGAA